LAGFKGVLHIALLLPSAKLFKEIAVTLRQLPIVGYIIAGIVVCPTVYGEMIIRQLADRDKDRYNPAYVAMTKDGRSYLGIVTASQMRKIRR
jgi:Kef-type K+ transport system membrane component KefB